MAASAWTVYSNAALGLTNGDFDLNGDTFIIALLTNSYTPAPNTDTTWSNVSAYEVGTGSGYTAGGVTLSQTCTLSTATVTFDAVDPSWSGFSATFRYMVIVRRAGGALAPSDLLLCYSDGTGGGSITGGGGTFTVTLNASGIFTVTHSP